MTLYAHEPAVLQRARELVALSDETRNRLRHLASALRCISSGNFGAAEWSLFFAGVNREPRDEVPADAKPARQPDLFAGGETTR